MRGSFFRNKKILIALIIVVIILVVAIVAFVALGVNKGKGKDSTAIKFPESSNTPSNNTNNKTGNKTNNKTNNKTDNKTGNGNSSKDFSDTFYGKAAEDFAEAFMDTKAMEDFLENSIDIKAYVAYNAVERDNSKFYDEYEKIADDDERIEETRKAFLELPDGYKMIIAFSESMQGMADELAKANEELNNQSNNETDNKESDKNETNSSNTENLELTEEDKIFKVTDVKEPEVVADLGGGLEISNVKATYSFLGQEQEITLVFVSDVLMYICDEEGVSILEGAGSDMNNTPETENDVEN